MSTKFIRPVVCLFCALAAGIPSLAQADGRRDYYFQQALDRYFPLQQNARTFGMAGSSVAVSSDSSSVTGNPAGLGMMEGGDASLTYSRNTFSGNEHPSYEEIEQDQDIGQALIAVPLVPNAGALPTGGNLGFGWTGYDGEADDSINSEVDGYRLSAAYAKAISGRTSLGYALTYFNDSLETDLFDYSMDDGFRHNFGVHQKLSDTVALGAILHFTHGDYELDDGIAVGDSEARQYGGEVGAGWQIGDTLITPSIDYTFYDTDGEVEAADPAIVVGGDEDGHVFNARIGVEHRLNDHLALRAGYRYAGLEEYNYDRDELEELEGSAKYNAFSLGAGTGIEIDSDYIQAIRLDYGVEYRAVGNDDWQHVVTLSIPFGLCRDPVPPSRG